MNIKTKKAFTLSVVMFLAGSSAQAGLLGSLVKGAAFGAGAAAASETVHAAVRKSNVDCKFPKNQKEKDQCAAAQAVQANPVPLTPIAQH